MERRAVFLPFCVSIMGEGDNSFSFPFGTGGKNMVTDSFICIFDSFMLTPDSKSGTDFFVMRKTLCLLAALALSSLSNAASFSLDLSPTGGGAQNTVSLDGITPQDIFGYETDVWHGTITKSALSGQVSLNDGSLGLQLGGVADVGKGNFAGLKFDMPSGVESAKMSFTITYTSAWGAANFNCDYTCNVYGFTAEGTSTVIGTWSLQNAKASLTQNEPVDVSFDLQLDPDANYSSFGLIFNNTRVANAGGMGCEISNILISGGAVPEPATASLGLLGLGALLLRRRRN